LHKSGKFTFFKNVRILSIKINTSKLIKEELKNLPVAFNHFLKSCSKLKILQIYFKSNQSDEVLIQDLLNQLPEVCPDLFRLVLVDQDLLSFELDLQFLKSFKSLFEFNLLLDKEKNLDSIVPLIPNINNLQSLKLVRVLFSNENQFWTEIRKMKNQNPKAKSFEVDFVKQSQLCSHCSDFSDFQKKIVIGCLLLLLLGSFCLILSLSPKK
jgi:hypothetical protein